MIVQDVRARKIQNSRGENTLAVVVETKDGKFEASAPGGVSRGRNEAEPFSVKGVDFSINFVNVLGKKIIIDKIIFNDFSDLAKLEELIRKFDKTKEFSLVGANAVYALEAALLKAIAASYELQLWSLLTEGKKPKKLPTPLGNCIGGGKHAKQEKKTDFQEFLLLPKTKHFFDAYFINLQSYKEAKKEILERDRAWKGSLTDESAIASTLDNEAVLCLLSDVSKKIKDTLNIEVRLGLDVAASSFWNGVNYTYKSLPDSQRLGREEQLNCILDLIEKYNLAYVEDPLDEKDFDGFARLLRIVKERNLNCLIAGDDLVCTQLERLQKAIETKSINAVVIKPNQNGSLLAVKEVIDLARKNDISTIISHRSGETLDNTIAHLAVGWGIPIIKAGILGRERFAKLHELLRIERALGKR